MKYQILSDIIDRLSKLGIPLQYGNNTDIAISTEFIDAGWGMGCKRIFYEALIFANEQYKVVYMYEKTTETGYGLSFGGEAETSFQTGKTLFRKVKSIQYGPDGKAYEYNIDLGEILKAVRDAAKLYGWRFETVINKNKAKYPAGYVPIFFNSALQTQTALRETITMPCIPPVQTEKAAVHAPPQNGHPQRTFFTETPKENRRPGSFFWWIGCILLVIVFILLLMFVVK